MMSPLRRSREVPRGVRAQLRGNASKKKTKKILRLLEPPSRAALVIAAYKGYTRSPLASLPLRTNPRKLRARLSVWFCFRCCQTPNQVAAGSLERQGSGKAKVGCGCRAVLRCTVPCCAAPPAMRPLLLLLRHKA